MTKAIIVLSGGQDSMTCLCLAIQLYGAENVNAIIFNYGQRHKIEIECAELVCQEFKIEYKIVKLDFLSSLVTSTLTGSGDTKQPHPNNKNLPSTFVPNRNAIFLTLAHAYAQELNASKIYTGVCQTDYSGYPDCRKDFIDRIQLALNVGYETTISIETPLMYLTKAETFALADKLGAMEIITKFSHTCYEGDHHTFNEWGYGCGECAACVLRKKGFAAYLQSSLNNGNET